MSVTTTVVPEKSRASKITYSTLLKLLGLIESEMTNHVEYYDQMFMLAQKNMKTRKRWDEVIGIADEQLWQRKYKEAKQREKEKLEARNAKNRLRLEKTLAVQPEFGKKKMVKTIFKTQKKEKTAAKDNEIDPDVLKYLGSDVNLDLIPDDSESDANQTTVIATQQDPEIKQN